MGGKLVKIQKFKQKEFRIWTKNIINNYYILPASNDFFEIGKFCDIGSQRWDNCGHVPTGGAICGSPVLGAVEHLWLVHCKCTQYAPLCAKSYTCTYILILQFIESCKAGFDSVKWCSKLTFWMHKSCHIGSFIT